MMKRQKRGKKDEAVEAKMGGGDNIFPPYVVNLTKR